MGQFDPTASETKLIAGFFSEGSKFLGNQVMIYPVTNYPQENGQGDPIPQWGSPITVNGMFDVRPNRRTLDGYGWYAEDPDLTPILLYLPQYDMKGNTIVLTQDVRIEVDNSIDGQTQEKLFEIHKFLATSIPGFYWVTWLTPARNSTPQVTTDPKQNFNFLNFSG